MRLISFDDICRSSLLGVKVGSVLVLMTVQLLDLPVTTLDLLVSKGDGPVS